jgi:DNA ligase-1
VNIIKTSDWYVSENKAGLLKFWRVHILESKKVNTKEYFTQTEWYQLTKTGRETKRQLSEPYFAEPTNVGRANERDSYNQAEFEYDAIIKKQRDKGFQLPGEKVQAYPMPMLAHKFKDHIGKVEWPVLTQPKLNGMRMLFDGLEGWSRGNKQVIPDVIKHLAFDTAGFILDGELMLPGNQLLQESMKAIKKYRPELSPKLEYHVYDIVDSELPYAKRYQLILDICHNAPENIKIVPADLCNSEAEVYKMHKTYVKEGFEGTMIRDMDMHYEIGKRSYSLLKLKDFVDAEYRIVDIIDGDGSDKNLAIFVLENNAGQHFNCRPEGSQENRRELYKSRSKLIGKYLTVRYQELSKDDIPIFPVGVSIREWGEF